METIEVVEKSFEDENEFGSPDNIIHIVMPDSQNLNEICEDNSLSIDYWNLLKTCSRISPKIFQQNYNSVGYKDYYKRKLVGNDFPRKNTVLTTTNAKTSSPDSDCDIILQSSLVNDFLNKPKTADVGLQTNFTDVEEDTSENLNLFYCTFYLHGDAQTYCNIVAKSLNGNVAENGILGSQAPIEELQLQDEIGRAILVSGHVIDVEKKAGRDVSGREIGVIKAEIDVNTADKVYGLRGRSLAKKWSNIANDVERNYNKRKKKDVVMKCKHCAQEFTTFCKLEKHSKLVHNSTEFSFSCNLCGQLFTRPHNLRRHQESKHRIGDKKFVCDICGRKFNRQDILTSHTYLVHSKSNVKDKALLRKRGQLFQCSYCKQYFSRVNNYNKHREGNLTCSQCGQVFPCKSSFRDHLNKEHSVLCDMCGKACANKQQLYAHKVLHTPKFTCKYCNKNFIWEPQYVVHLATHTGIKPLNCDVCGKSFAHASAVKKHKWHEHTEANKKFPCDVCGKTFVFKAKLDSHLRIHTGEKPFACHICPTAFSHNCNLAAHVKSVHGIYLQPANKRLTSRKSPVKVKVKKKMVPKPSVETVPLRSTQLLPVIDLHTSEVREREDIPSAELITQSFDNDAPIYQIVYAYPR